MFAELKDVIKMHDCLRFGRHRAVDVERVSKTIMAKLFIFSFFQSFQQISLLFNINFYMF